MNWFEALILGILQGLTEFLPVSSSGHLEIGKVFFGIDAEKSLVFTIVVHGATVLSTIVVFRKDLWQLFTGSLALRYTPAMKYNLRLAVSMVPVIILGLFYRDKVEELFTGNLLLVGTMLLVTALLLASTRLIRKHDREITVWDALLIGIAQAAAVLPGLSRSGTTISAGLLLGNKREEVTRFSFLMVLVPIIGANLVDLLKYDPSTSSSISAWPLIVGFMAAFITGLAACSLMIRIVKKGNLNWFAAYCLILGILAIILD